MAHFRLIFFLGVSLLGSLSVGCSVNLLQNLSEAEANEIIAVLHKHGIQGEKKRAHTFSRSSFAVSVHRDDEVEGWRIVRQANLPRPAHAGIQELFAKPSLIPSATEQRALLNQALSGDIAQTLQSVEGVLEARVHLALTERDPLTPPDIPDAKPKASVLLRLSKKIPLPEGKIKALVAGAVKDLSPEAVSVVSVMDHMQHQATDEKQDSLQKIGPFLVGSSSQRLFLVTLMGGLLMVIILGGSLLLALRKIQRINQHLHQQMDINRKAVKDGSKSPLDLETSLTLLGQTLAHPPEATSNYPNSDEPKPKR